ncbi:hypothetical protein [Oceanobacillus kapialis]|uniref:DUF4030 domain-containing protein n=1 Tax=Oceanobacillus kapialis TaxID=481353 RepID=A0ABW5PXH8_9BACI
MKTNIKSEIDQIELPDELDTVVKAGVDKAYKGMQQRKKKGLSAYFKNHKKNRIVLAGCILAIAFILLINTMVQSKTLYVFASEIPVIADVFEIDPLTNQIKDELDKHDYYTENIEVGVSLFPGKEISISLGGTSDYQGAIGDQLKQTVEKFLQREGYHSFAINLEKQDEQIPYSLSNEQRMEKVNMEGKIKGTLSNLNIEPKSIFVEPIEKYVSVSVSTDIQSEDELRKHAQTVKMKLIDHMEFMGYEVHVTAVGPEMSVDNDRSTVKPLTDLDEKITHLAQLLTEKKIYKVTSFSFKEEPLTFTIETNVDSTDKEHGHYLQNVIEDYLNSTNIPPAVESYRIDIYSKDGNKIN